MTHSNKRQRLTGWRRIANAIWREPNDPQIYGLLEVDATPLAAFAAEARAHGDHLTPTHLVGRALARSLRQVPELNVRLVGDYAVARESVDVFFITSVANGHDLTGVKIRHCDQKSAATVARELSERSRLMKKGRDPDLARAKRTMDRLSGPALRVALHLAAWLAGERGKAVRSIGLDATPFGSAMVSSVGMFGLPTGFAPIAWMYRVPVFVLVSQVVDKPVAVDGRVVIRPMLPISVTIDHRYVDGAELRRALDAFREYLADPWAFEARGKTDNVVPLHVAIDAKNGELQRASAHDD